MVVSKDGSGDFFYIKDENNLMQDRSKRFTSKFAKSYDKGHPKAKQRPGEWKDGLFWMEYTFPPIHFETNKKYRFTKTEIGIICYHWHHSVHNRSLSYWTEGKYV